MTYIAKGNLIGVTHTHTDVRDAVIEHIDSNYPDLESLMLEIYPNHEIIDDGFFCVMARHFAAKGVKIIEGDPFHWSRSGMNPDMALELYLNRPEVFHIAEVPGQQLNTGADDLRHSGTEVTYLRDRPQVTVMGAKHAFHLHDKFSAPIAYFIHEQSVLDGFGQGMLDLCREYMGRADEVYKLG